MSTKIFKVFIIFYFFTFISYGEDVPKTIWQAFPKLSKGVNIYKLKNLKSGEVIFFAYPYTNSRTRISSVVKQGIKNSDYKKLRSEIEKLTVNIVNVNLVDYNRKILWDDFNWVFVGD